MSKASLAQEYVVVPVKGRKLPKSGYAISRALKEGIVFVEIHPDMGNPMHPDWIFGREPGSQFHSFTLVEGETFFRALSEAKQAARALAEVALRKQKKKLRRLRKLIEHPKLAPSAKGAKTKSVAQG